MALMTAMPVEKYNQTSKSGVAIVNKYIQISKTMWMICKQMYSTDHVLPIKGIADLHSRFDMGAIS